MPQRKPIVADFELWTEVARSVTPLDLRSTVHNPGPVRAAAPSTPNPPGTIQNRQFKAVSPAGQKSPREKQVAPPPLTGLDRRTSRRLTRGKTDIDGRIDLHGETGETARVRLLGFLSQARAKGARTVLIITGKGRSQFSTHTLHGSRHFHTPERGGRLRRLVTQWFDEVEFRALVAGYQPAHPRHGGGGAFYVRLRRNPANRPLR